MDNKEYEAILPVLPDIAARRYNPEETDAYDRALHAGIQAGTLLSARMLLAEGIELEAQMKHEYEAIEARLQRTKTDSLTGALTRTGLRDELEHNIELKEELLRYFEPITDVESVSEKMTQGWGVVFIDIRGVNFANTHGTAVGDAYIDTAAKIITNELAKTSRVSGDATPQIDDERRITPKDVKDIVVRYGGDELAVIVRNVKPHELYAVAGRLAEKFSVESAVGRYENDGQMPVIAGVSTAHVYDIPAAPNVPNNPTVQMKNGQLFEGVTGLCAIADEEQARLKEYQYDEMWERYLETKPRAERELLEHDKPADQRKIISLFYAAVCHDFAEYPRDYLGDN